MPSSGTSLQSALVSALTLDAQLASALGGRKVYDGGGIMPDERIDPEYISRFAMTLYAMGYVDDFAGGDR